MQKEEFFRQLYAELIAQGASAEMAKRQIRAILQSVTEDDLQDIETIESHEEIENMASAILSVQKRKAEHDESLYGDDDDMKVYDATASQAISTSNSVAVNDDMMYAPTTVQGKIISPKNTKGKLIFWGIFIGTLPLTLAFLLAYTGIFGVIFAALIAVIFALVAGLILGVAGGTLVAMVGIVYGIAQLIITAGSKAVGLYEIGLGVIIGGIVMFAGILVYNVAIRLVPFIMSLLGRLFKFCAGKLKHLFQTAKEACYRL